MPTNGVAVAVLCALAFTRSVERVTLDKITTPLASELEHVRVTALSCLPSPRSRTAVTAPRRAHTARCWVQDVATLNHPAAMVRLHSSELAMRLDPDSPGSPTAETLPPRRSAAEIQQTLEVLRGGLPPTAQRMLPLHKLESALTRFVSLVPASTHPAVRYTRLRVAISYVSYCLQCAPGRWRRRTCSRIRSFLAGR